MKVGFVRVLVLCPHTDDEIGCAGTILRLRERGARVRLVALSSCEQSVPNGFQKDVLETEYRASAAELGLVPDDVDVLGFRVRYFPVDRQAILECFVGLARDYAPDLVLLPSSTDTHQDHATVQQEGFRAFKHTTMLGYEAPTNERRSDQRAFVELKEEHIRRKIESARAYLSQAHRPYFSESFVRGLATVRGAQCGRPYAEAFEVVQLVL
jgi:LmbE family N-acetylglucosaminyl deacetylase